MHLVARVDRDILANDETLVGETITGFVEQIGFAVIVESPSAARVVDEMTMLVLLVWTQPRDPAGFAMRTPEFRVDTAVDIDRRDEDIGYVVVALGMTGLAGQRDTDLPKLRRQGGIAPSGFSIDNISTAQISPARMPADATPGQQEPGRRHKSAL